VSRSYVDHDISLPSNRFTMVPHHVVHDVRVSPKARLLWIHLAGLRPGWEVSVVQMAKDIGIGKNTITSGTRELREYGYLRLDRITDERGQVTEWRYAVCDPGPGFPDPENRDGDRPQSPDPENRDIEKELSSSLREEEQDSSKYSRARADDSGTSPLPDDWEPTDRHRTKCSTLGLDVDRLAAEMRQWAYAKNVRRKSWNVTFNSFIARAKPKPTKATHVPTETWDNL